MAESTGSLHEQLTLSESNRNLCEVCNEPAGSVSEGTGYPMIRDTDRKFRHMKCKPLSSVNLMTSYL